MGCGLFAFHGVEREVSLLNTHDTHVDPVNSAGWWDFPSLGAHDATPCSGTCDFRSAVTPQRGRREGGGAVELLSIHTWTLQSGD